MKIVIESGGLIHLEHIIEELLTKELIISRNYQIKHKLI